MTMKQILVIQRILVVATIFLVVAGLVILVHILTEQEY